MRDVHGATTTERHTERVPDRARALGWSTWLTLALALTGSLAIGCSKEDPRPTPATAAAEDDVAPPIAPTPPAERAAEAAPAPSVPDPATTPSGPVAVPATAARAVPDDVPDVLIRGITPITLPRFPDEVTAVLGTPSLEALVTALAASGRMLDPDGMPPDPMAGLREAIRIQSGLASADWIDGTRPVRVAIPDPKAYRDGFLAAVPHLGDEASVRQALGPGLEAAEGHAGRLGVGPRTVFVDVHAGHVVLTSHSPIFGALRGWVDEVLLAWRPPHAVSLEVSFANLRRVFAHELEMTRRLAEGVGAQIAARAAIPMQVDTLKQLVAGVFDFIAHADRAGFALVPAGKDVGLGFAVRAGEGTPLAETIRGLGGRTPEQGRLLTPDAWLGVVGDVAATFDEADRQAIMTTLTAEDAGEMRLSEEKAREVADAVAQLTAVSTGDSAFALRVDGSFPFGVETVVGVSDGAKARAAMMTLLSVVWDKLVARAREEAKTAQVRLRELERGDLGELVALVNSMTAELGAKLAVEESERDGVRVSALVLTVDWESGALAKSDPQTFAPIAALVGPRVELALATGETRIAMALGPHGVARAVELAKGAPAGGEATLEAAAAGAFLAGSLHPDRLLSGLASLPAFSAQAKAFRALPPGAFVARGATDGETLLVTLSIPLDVLVALMNIR